MKVEIPKICPICSSTLVRVNMQLFCENDDCEGRTINRISSFCKKRKIKGLAIKSLEKLNLNSIADLYSLDMDYLASVLGKNGEKIYKEIQDSLNTDIGSLIGSLGIRLVGITTAAKLKGTNLLDIDYTGLPDKARQNFKEFLESELYYELLEIPFNFNQTKQEVKDEILVCLTGTFERPKKEIQKQLGELGYICSDSVTKSTKLLITNDLNSTSLKMEKAKKYNINIKLLEEILK